MTTTQELIRPGLIEVYEDWWNGRSRQPLVAVYVGNPGFDVRSIYRPWMDRSVPEYRLFSYAVSRCAKENSFEPLHDALDVLEASFQMSGTNFLGAAFPSIRTDFGPVPVAGIISGYSEFDLSSMSVWFELAEGWTLTRIAALQEDASSPWAGLWRYACEETVCRLGGRRLIMESAMFGLMDILAALRTTDRLLFDCIDSPDMVLAALAGIERVWWRFQKETRELIDPPNGGLYSTWIGVLSNRPYAISQADFSVMLSPAMFEEFALPGLRSEAERIGRSVYHLDGPEQIKHLDMILSIPEIRAIQWPPFPGQPVLSGSWDGMIRKVIDSGRRLVMSDIPAEPDAVRLLFSRFPAEAFHLSMWAPDAAAGEAVLKAAGADVPHVMQN